MYPGIKEIEADHLAALLGQDPKAVRVVDVRQPYEFMSGTVPGAELLPLGALPARAADIEHDRPVVVICRSGSRSAHACAYLAARGHRNVYNLRGGMLSWMRSGLPHTLPETA